MLALKARPPPLYLEYQPGDYERAFTLSGAVDPAGIEARVAAVARVSYDSIT